MRYRFPTALTVLALIGSAACGRGGSAEEGQASGEVINVTVQAVKTGTLRDVVRAGGRVVPSTVADFLVTASEPAEIVDLPGNEGDKVQFEITQSPKGPRAANVTLVR